MKPEDDRSGIAGIVHGDAASARELRTNLAVFARQSTSREINGMVADVLGGRRDVRDVLRSPEFREAGLRRLSNLEEGIARLTAEQRGELFSPPHLRHLLGPDAAGHGTDQRPESAPDYRFDADEAEITNSALFDE